MANLEPAVGQDAVAPGGLFDNVAAMRVALAPGDKDGLGVNDFRPPAVIGIALVKNVKPAPAKALGDAHIWACQIGSC
jgi:hypothetical protein